MAGRIPQSFINDLLDRVDIVDVVERRMTIKKAGKNYSGLCPFHDEKTPSFSVSPDKQFFHCFGCQESGTALTFVMKFDRLEFVEAVESLAHDLGLEVPREQGRGGGRPKAESDLYGVLEQAEKYYRGCLRDAPQAIEYLKARGLTGEIARDFGIGYAPDGWQNLSQSMPQVKEKQLLDAGLANTSEKGRVYDRFRDRITFPIRDTRGRVIGFGGRVMSKDDGPKYLNSPETALFHKSKELYGLYEARKALRNIDRLLVVEGYMDVVALAQFGVANVVATLGTATGTPHFEKLYRYCDEVVCCFDGDQAGRQAAWKALDNALPALNEHRQLKFMFLPDGEDPDSLIRATGTDRFNSLVEEAMPALEFMVQKLAQGLDMDSLDGKGRFLGLIDPYVKRLPDGVLKTLLNQRIQSMTGMSASGPAPVRSKPVARQPNSKASRVSERLLSILVKHPDFWREIDEEGRAKLLANQEDELWRNVAGYVDAHPEADAEELLVVFDEPSINLKLREWASKSLPIDRNALQKEFTELCATYLRNLASESRKATLEALKDSPNIDGLRKYWAQRSGGDDYS